MKGGHTAQAVFQTTHWTQVLEAVHPHASSDNAAFADLYLAYWHPLYAFVRRRGFSSAEAEDLIQDFFARLVSQQSLSGLRRDGGKFRSFLLKSLDHFLANEWDRVQAQKRGHGQRPLSLDGLEAEARLALNVPDKETPESLFEKRWAFAVLAQVTNRLRAEYLEDGKGELFEQFRVYLQGDRAGPGYAVVGAPCGKSSGRPTGNSWLPPLLARGSRPTPRLPAISQTQRTPRDAAGALLSRLAVPGRAIRL